MGGTELFDELSVKGVDADDGILLELADDEHALAVVKGGGVIIGNQVVDTRRITVDVGEADDVRDGKLCLCLVGDDDLEAGSLELHLRAAAC